MTIEQAMKLTHTINVLRHPQGVVIMQNDAEFIARFFKDPKTMHDTWAGEPKGRGKTP